MTNGIRANFRTSALAAATFSLTACQTAAPGGINFNDFNGQSVSSDDCNVSSIVNEYYSAGRHNTVEPRFPRSFDERLYGFIVYSPDEKERYRARYQAPMESLLKYVISHQRYEHSPGCSSELTVRLGIVDYEQVFSARSATRLCVRVHETSLDKENVATQSCTDLNTLENTIVVSLGS